MAIQTRLRRWGNSFGVVVPAEAVRERRMQDGEEVVIEIEKISPVRKIFGSLKDWKINTQKFKDELRKEEREDDKKLFS